MKRKRFLQNSSKIRSGQSPTLQNLNVFGHGGTTSVRLRPDECRGSSVGVLQVARKCLFFDRDGIVNESPGPGYVERWDDFQLIPEFVVAARTAMANGYALAIVTNQRGVARGIMTRETLDDIHAKMLSALYAAGVSLLGVYCCMHERDSCDCRKPLPGLLLQAAEEHHIDLYASWMVGDNETDVQAGRAAGCRTILVSEVVVDSAADFRVSNMTELPGKLEELLGKTEKLKD